MNACCQKIKGPILSLVAIFIVLTTSAPAFSYTSMLYGECTKGNGIQKTIEREMSIINIVEISGNIDLKILSNQTEQYVRITGDENILPLITTVPQGNQLSIYPERPICSDLSISIEISVGHLLALISSGSGNITAKEINNRRFSLVMNDSGNVELEGFATLFEVEISGSGDLEARGLKTRGTTMHVSGSGYSNVHASETLHVDMVGSGDINYFGNPPEVIKEIVGIGSLNQIE